MEKKTKTCTKCKIPKPLKEFSRDNRHSDRKRSECKECAGERAKRDNEKRKLGDQPFIF